MHSDQIDVLLIEDNPGDQRLIQQMLVDSNDIEFTLHTGNRLIVGLEILEKQNVGVVLLDLSLPDSQGLQTLSTLHNHSPNVPVVVLTGFKDADVGLQAVQNGAQDYLVKGEVNSDLLTRALRYAIERHHADEALRKREEEYRSLIDDVFNDSSVAVFIINQDHRIVWINGATEEYFGLKRENIINTDSRKMLRDHMRDIMDDPDAFDRAVSGSPQNGESLICHVTANPDMGIKERWLEHWSQPIRAGLYAGGRIEQYTDITEHKRIEAAEREQRALAEALSDSVVALTSTLDLDEVLDRILENVRYVVPHDTAEIIFIRDGIARIVRTSGRGKYDANDQRLGARFAVKSNAYLSYMCDTGEAVVIDDIQTDLEWSNVPGDEWLHACVAAPIRLQSETIGFINVLGVTPGCLGVTHAERLKTFSAYAAIAIQNAKLFEQSRELAAVAERQRIARDLHDAVSQSLFSASIIAQSLPRLWHSSPDRVLGQLEYLDELTQSALTEMRMLLLELRPHALRDVTLSNLLRQLVRTIETRKQIQISVNLDELSDLQPEVKIALYRIAQESLNNTAKHSQATQAHLSLRREHNQIVLSIEDNGVGFSMDDDIPTNLGLKIMEERAEEIGATLEVASELGDGTTVKVIWIDEAIIEAH